MSTANKILMGASGAGGPVGPSDDEFNRVSFLSHFDGANNGVNNVFDDASASNHTITANGDVTQGSFGPFARPDGEWGVDFPADQDMLTIPTSTDLNLGSGDFTLECFIFVQNPEDNGGIMSKRDNEGGFNNSYRTSYRTGSKKVSFSMDTGSVDILSPVVEKGIWTHIAVVRNSGTLSIYAAGVQGGTATSNTADVGSTWPFTIGSQYQESGASPQFSFIGQISNVRFVKGTAVYSGSSFTPPTGKLTAITNTKLLTCQSNRFVDNSASGHTITPSGNAAVTAFGPFLTSSVYDPAVNGASAYMDGTGDYLNTAASSEFAVGAGDFTISVWVYNLSGSLGLFDIGASGTGLSTGYDAPSIGITGSGAPGLYLFGFGGGSPVYSTAATGSTINEWEHIALVRSGSTVTFYKNGIAGATKTSSHDVTENIIAIGGYYSTSYLFKGYMSDFRLVKGTAVYTSNFTPPTAPLTAITNTKLLLNMADGQAIDSAAQNNLTLVGTASLSTTEKKFGDTSIYLSGSGDDDYVMFDTLNGPLEGLSTTSPATIEGYFNWDGTQKSGGFRTVIGINRLSDGNNTLVLYCGNSSGQGILGLRYSGGSEQVLDSSIATDTWHHFAMVLNNGSYKFQFFLNGTSVFTSTSTINVAPSDCSFIIGAEADGANAGSLGDAFTGYIDEIRVSHMARYTSNFTAPSEPFADKGQ